MAKKKRMRLPNGFGQISEIKNQRLRRPFRAMVTVGKSETGRPICQLLKPQAYFETYNEAYQALMEYNKDPATQLSEMLIDDLFDEWREEHAKKVTEHTAKKIKWNWDKYCSEVKNLRVVDVRVSNIKSCLEKAPTPSVKKIVKNTFNMLFDYAVENEIVEQNVSRKIKNSGLYNKDQHTHHISFTEEEMKRLDENIINDPFVDMLYIQCYMGWRPREMGAILLENVNLDENYIVGGMKTESGINRIVPIHEKIKERVKKYYDKAVDAGSKFLFFTMRDGKPVQITYFSYGYHFKQIKNELNLNPEHKPHDPRKQFVTMCKKYNVDEYAIKRIIGHTIADLTENTYTDRNASWLLAEVNKIL